MQTKPLQDFVAKIFLNDSILPTLAVVTSIRLTGLSLSATACYCVYISHFYQIADKTVSWNC